MFIDKMALAKFFQKKLGLHPITFEDLRENIIKKKVKKSSVKEKFFSEIYQ